MYGLTKVTQERLEHIFKHGKDTIHDYRENDKGQLVIAARMLSFGAGGIDDGMEETAKSMCPEGWDEGLWAHMLSKSYEERITIAAALLVAEGDRIEYDKQLLTHGG